MAYFTMRASLWGPYVQVRVRANDGREDTVDRLFSAQECRDTYRSLGQEHRPMISEEDLEAEIKTAGL